MTLPSERTRAVIRTAQFLDRLADSHGGFKRIPKQVREIARGLLRHYPHLCDVGRADCFDTAEAKRLAEEDS
jgi:hypothetical protein